MSENSASRGDLVRRGFMHPAAASAHLALLAEAGLGEPWDDPSTWVEASAGAADPDHALEVVAALAGTARERLRELLDTPGAAARLVAVAGASQPLGQHLIRHPEDLALLATPYRRRHRDELVAEVLDSIGANAPAGPVPQAPDELRLANKRALVRIAAHDLTAREPDRALDTVMAELSDLADAIMTGAFAIACSQVPDHARTRLAVIAMGKCGARELNYISDIDVIFMAEPADGDTTPEQAVAIATKLAAAMMRACSAHTPTGTIWQVDAALRPEGNAGQLVRTTAGMKAYYERWASNWEFQALLKARPMAGDLALGQQFVDLVAPMVWQVSERDGFMAQTQAMRKRVVDHIPPKQAAREIKLGVGGLRDTEFTVQMLQLVHGKADDRLHLRGTIESLHALKDATYVGRADATEMEQAYRFQRLLEHRVQLHKLRRTHLMPDDPDGLRILARGVGLRTGEEVHDKWRASARAVQRLHQRVFYSPLLETVAQIPTADVKLTPEAAEARLKALGFADPQAAMRHIQALTTGVTRASDIQRQLMPAMLGWFAEAPNPDAGLLAFRQISEALKSSPWYLRALRDEGQMASTLAHILSSSRYAVDLLKRNPESVEMLAKPVELTRDPERLHTAMHSVVSRHQQSQEAIDAVRAIRRRELFRVAVADLTNRADLTAVGHGLTDLASATICAALEVAHREVPDAPPVGVVSMGRWGGQETAYSSDCDAMFIIDDTDDPEAVHKATQVVTKVRKWLNAPGPDPALEIDTDLRPEGKDGAMVRTLGSYRAYYDRWSATWEAQALIRAGYGAGPVELVTALLTSIDPIRYPAEGLAKGQLTEIRKLKARMERERMPRGVDPKRHVKLGPGGLVDIEWTIQLLQLQHGARIPGLRTTSTLAALAAADEAELLTASQHEALREAWLLASRIRNANMLSRARASDAFPSDARERGNVAHLLGRQPGRIGKLLDDWMKASRRAEHVVNTVFWGGETG
ncbi:bifunctional [glutamine synthetase] adenylyltransferase/[glutamine synthetase]-adenylyl-L-tyrosine phosphorylase [Propionibacteriaceae bacterium G1746]|uniref:bifunctional [glutamine synthetase] adenylyltransferase/[glutamine synthetase]-adenylyl-L-tyrosine phosphorylase n=1 Tax=Aestuariimicrobium sp. G57 TaxID=3418485 RepID=UPI003C19F46A